MKQVRSTCKQPESCVAGKRGPCPLCHDTSLISEGVSKRNRLGYSGWGSKGLTYDEALV